MQEQLFDTLNQFDLPAELDQLPGGSQPTFRAGNAVLKRVKATSLENNHSPQLIQWIAGFYAAIATEWLPSAPTDCHHGWWLDHRGWLDGREFSRWSPRNGGRHPELYSGN